MALEISTDFEFGAAMTPKVETRARKAKKAWVRFILLMSCP
jgi:hypothetical protein